MGGGGGIKIRDDWTESNTVHVSHTKSKDTSSGADEPGWAHYLGTCGNKLVKFLI